LTETGQFAESIIVKVSGTLIICWKILPPRV